LLPVTSLAPEPGRAPGRNICLLNAAALSIDGERDRATPASLDL